jgi:hypothetical protein
MRQPKEDDLLIKFNNNILLSLVISAELNV